MQLFGWAVPLRRHNIPECARSVRLHTMHRQRIITYVERAIIEGPRLTVSVAKRLGDRACNVPVHQGRPEVEAATLVPLILASVFFFNRMAAKSMGLAGGWGSDDYTIIGAYVRYPL